MSWSITGTVEIKDGLINTENLFWSPSEDSLAEGPKTQAEFLLDVMEAAAEQELIDGWYSLSLLGHYPTPDQTGQFDRKSISMNFSAVSAPASPPVT